MITRAGKHLTIVCAALIGVTVFVAGTVASAATERRLDYDIFSAIAPIGASSVDPRPAVGEILLLQFWASWCRSCGTLMWDMDEIVGQNPGLKYIAVSLDDEFDNARNYIRKHILYEKYGNRYFVDTNKTLSASVGISAVPTIVLVDSSGRILLQKSGHLNSADLQDLVSTFRDASK